MKTTGATCVSDHAVRLEKLYSRLSTTIDAPSVAAVMFVSSALTLEDLQSIQSKRKQPVKAAKQLLNIIIKQSREVYGCFLDALKRSGDEGETQYRLILEDNCAGRAYRCSV